MDIAESARILGESGKFEFATLKVVGTSYGVFNGGVERALAYWQKEEVEVKKQNDILESDRFNRIVVYGPYIPSDEHLAAPTSAEFLAAAGYALGVEEDYFLMWHKESGTEAGERIGGVYSPAIKFGPASDPGQAGMSALAWVAQNDQRAIAKAKAALKL